MMRSFLLGILCFCTDFIPVATQPMRTDYLTEAMRPGTRAFFKYKRDVYKSDSGYVYMDYQKNGKLKFRGEYASVNTDMPHGHFRFYQRNGKLEAEGYYRSGDMVGEWVFYDKHGSERLKIDYDLPDNPCASLDSSINYKPMQSPEENGLQQIPTFPGGENAFYAFLYERIVYPPLAKMYYKTGRAIGIFTIDKSGEVCNVHVEGDVDRDIKRETLRILQLQPKWEPGKIGSSPVKVKYTCPITFKFE